MDQENPRYDNPAAVNNQGAVTKQAVHQTINGNLYFNDARPKDDDVDALGSLAFPGMDERRGNVKRPHMHTCTWILELKEYKEWLDRPHGLLWVKGKPGAGKSTLMAFMHREIKNRLLPESVTLEFFFSARGTELQHTPLGMLRSLLNQSCRQDVETRTILHTIYHGKCAEFGRAKEGWEWRQPELEVILQERIVASAKRRPLIIFVDALDEAGATAALELVKYFDRVNDYLAMARASGKICISCRHYPVLISESGIEVCIDELNRDDISAFIHDSLRSERLLTEETMGQQSWDTLETELVDSADGIFQWVRLVVPLVQIRLRDGESVANIQRFLHRVPHELREVYNYILHSVIQHEYRPRALALFQWVCLAERPLSVTEIRYAMAAAEARTILSRIPCHEASSFVPDDSVMKRQVKALSGGLIEVIEDNNRQNVQVIHQSVNDFLLAEGFRILVDIQDQHEILSSKKSTSTGNSDSIIQSLQGVLYRACIHYLVTENIDNIENEDERRPLDLWPFLDYATVNIFLHGEKARNYRFEDIQQEICRLEEIIPRWITSYQRLRRWEMESPKKETTLLHIACGNNLESIVSVLLSRKLPPSKADGGGNTALHHAARRGFSEMGKMLVRKGAAPNVANSNGETPLTLAVGHGHREFVEFLLREGANVNQGDGFGGNALQRAAAKGSKEMTRVLLDAGVDVNTQGGRYHTALQAASWYGSKEVIQMLLDAGADVNAQGGRYHTALQAASWHGSNEVIQILLDAVSDCQH